MDLIDTHVHVVSADLDRYPLDRAGHPGGGWVDVAPDVATFVAGLEPAGVGAAVLVQPHGAYRHDNSYTCDAAATDERLAPVVIVDPHADDAVDLLRDAADRGAKGVRLFSIPTPDVSWLDAAAGDRLFGAAADLGLTVGICVLPEELDVVARCVGRHRVEVVVDHCGFAPIHLPDGDPTMRPFAALCDDGNVIWKVTTHVIDHWIAAGPALDELFATLAGRVGVDRLVWGSDYAQTHDRPYGELADLARTALAPLGDDASTLASTARRLWF